jgi:hypothetical protein
VYIQHTASEQGFTSPAAGTEEEEEEEEEEESRQACVSGDAMRDCPALHMVCERVAEWVAHVTRVAAGLPSHFPVVGPSPAHTWRLPDRHIGDNGRYTRGGGGGHQVETLETASFNALYICVSVCVSLSVSLCLSLSLSQSLSVCLSLSVSVCLSLSLPLSPSHAISHLGVASCPCHWVPLLLALCDNRIRDTVIDPRAPHSRTTVRIGRGGETGIAVIATLREVASYEGGSCEESSRKSHKGEKWHTPG